VEAGGCDGREGDIGDEGGEGEGGCRFARDRKEEEELSPEEGYVVTPCSGGDGEGLCAVISLGKFYTQSCPRFRTHLLHNSPTYIHRHKYQRHFRFFFGCL